MKAPPILQVKMMAVCAQSAGLLVMSAFMRCTVQSSPWQILDGGDPPCHRRASSPPAACQRLHPWQIRLKFTTCVLQSGPVRNAAEYVVGWPPIARSCLIGGVVLPGDLARIHFVRQCGNIDAGKDVANDAVRGCSQPVSCPFEESQPHLFVAPPLGMPGSLGSMLSSSAAMEKR